MNEWRNGKKRGGGGDNDRDKQLAKLGGRQDQRVEIRVGGSAGLKAIRHTKHTEMAKRW
jgi:hypothetical protein